MFKPQVNKATTLKKIRYDYPKFDKYSDDSCLTMYQSLQEQQVINEFLNRTISIQSTSKELKHRFKDKYAECFDGKGYTTKKENDFVFITVLSKHIDFIDDINYFMTTFGWYPAALYSNKTRAKYTDANLKQFKSFNNIVIQYEAKWDIEIDLSNINYLYHVTADIRLNKIKLMGLTPKTGCKIGNHPNRIYFVTTNNLNDLEDLCYKLWDSDKSKELIEYYYVLQIDIRKLKEDLELFEDPNEPEFRSFWCYQNIPPRYIKAISKILINPKM